MLDRTSENRVTEVISYFNQHGLGSTISKFGLSRHTIRGYKSRYNRFYTTQSSHENDSESKKRHTKYDPKVLVFDIETSLCKGVFWTTGKQIITHNQILKDWNIITWSAKWLFSPEIMDGCLTPSEAKRGDDSRIVKKLWALFDQADVVIAHNGARFDVKKSNVRFLLNGLTPPSPYQIIDTLIAAKKNFNFSSNRLDFLGRIITNKGKLETDFDLWIRCMNGDKEALDYMVKYNHEDVLLLEEVYMELRPWIRSHPNLSVYAEITEECCPVCMSKNIIECGDYATPAGRFDSLRCGDCGSIMRRRKHNQSKEEKSAILLPTSR